MGVTRNANNTLFQEDLKERYQTEDRGINGKIILDWIFRKYGRTLWTGFIWLTTGASGGILSTR
jgi:hypothetical protein